MDNVLNSIMILIFNRLNLIQDMLDSFAAKPVFVWRGVKVDYERTDNTAKI